MKNNQDFLRYLKITTICGMGMENITKEYPTSMRKLISLLKKAKRLTGCCDYCGAKAFPNKISVHLPKSVKYICPNCHMKALAFSEQFAKENESSIKSMSGAKRLFPKCMSYTDQCLRAQSGSSLSQTKFLW